MSDHPYLIASIIFGILFVIVYFFVSVPRTIDMPGAESAQEDIETRKRKAQKIRARTRVFGIGGVIGLCLVTYLIIWVATPARKVYGALWPSATPTITSTATATATRTTTPTPRISPTSKLFGTITAYAVTPSAGTPKATTLQPSGSTGGSSVTVIQTRVVIQTRIVYITQFVVMTVPVTVVVTATPIPAASETPSITPTASETPTSTETPTPSATSTPTNTGTLLP